jgi:anhydro-N-acetylmuramic acid kinase
MSGIIFRILLNKGMLKQISSLIYVLEDKNAMYKQIKNSYCCVGLMSGTSLDGLDIVLCNLEKTEAGWRYHIQKSATITYSEARRDDLLKAWLMNGKELLKLNRRYANWVADQVNLFLEDVDEMPDLIASHGHTVFHEPKDGFNFQLGDGNIIAAKTGITTVSDFRSLCVCLGGEGAPLVPIGDMLLFSDYDACVNLGGFANVSSQIDGARVAWDICPVNFVINCLVAKTGLTMDKDGELAKQGRIIPKLKDELDIIPYYKEEAPKSLAQEWVEKEFWPIIRRYNKHALHYILRTCYEHFTDVIAADLNGFIDSGKILFTGGGVYNQYFMQLLRKKLKAEVYIPDLTLINYKEALIFALLGVLRVRGEVNCLKTVTGSKRDNCSGAVILG